MIFVNKPFWLIQKLQNGANTLTASYPQKTGYVIMTHVFSIMAPLSLSQFGI